MSKLIDLSSNNHPNDQLIDWQQVAAAGITHVYVKAGEGTGRPIYQNPFLRADVMGAKAFGLKVGTYWFDNTGYSIEEQKYVWGLLNQSLPLDLKEALDFESVRDPQRLAQYESELSYFNRDYFDGGCRAPLLWLAWPGWNGEDLSQYGKVVIVQTGEENIPGIPATTDVNIVLDEQAILQPEVKVSETFSQNQPDTGQGPITDAKGSSVLVAPAVGGRLTKSGSGYYIVFADGGVDCFGDAQFHGSYPQLVQDGKAGKLSRPIVGFDVKDDESGYILFAEDGGVFPFGSVDFRGVA